jgi:hypothetical protein
MSRSSAEVGTHLDGGCQSRQGSRSGDFQEPVLDSLDWVVWALLRMMPLIR